MVDVTLFTFGHYAIGASRRNFVTSHDEQNIETGVVGKHIACEEEKRKTGKKKERKERERELSLIHI